MSSKTVILQIPWVEPQGQPRPRVYHNYGRIVTHSPHNAYYHKIMLAAISARMQKGAFPPDGHINVAADIFFAVPPSLSKKEKAARLKAMYHTQKPDCDNLAKAILDALVAARLIADDRQVAGLSVHKKWSTTHCTYIEIEWNNEEAENNGQYSSNMGA